MFNIEETKKMIEVMQAYVEGKEIQYMRIYTTSPPEWKDIPKNNPSTWDWDNTIYRIKPVAIPLHRRYLWRSSTGKSFVSAITKSDYDLKEDTPETYGQLIQWIDTDWQGDE